MEEIINTHKGEYLSAHPKISYSKFHNKLVAVIEKSFITIHDSNEEFWGCGGLIEYKNKDICVHFILTAAHVIKYLCNETNNSIIKIPFNNLMQDNNNLSLELDIKLCPKVIDCCNDIALLKISPEKFSKAGYRFFQIIDNESLNICENMKVLVFGIPWNRMKRAYRKNREKNTQQIVVNGFQFPTRITRIENNSIYIDFPNDIILLKDSPKKGKNIDPSGLSGSLLWSYEKKGHILSA